MAGGTGNKEVHVLSCVPLPVGNFLHGIQSLHLVPGRELHKSQHSNWTGNVFQWVCIDWSVGPPNSSIGTIKIPMCIFSLVGIVL